VAVSEPRRWWVDAPELGGAGEIWAYGHFGRPVIAFPSQEGPVWQYAQYGMVDAIRWLLDEGRVKLYAVPTFDGATWFDGGLPLEERARRYGAYTAWLHGRVLPSIIADCGGRSDVIATGCSWGAYHAAHLTLQRADLVPVAIAMSGVYDVEAIGAWGQPGEATYFANPMAYVANLHGDHLGWLQRSARLVLVCGQGQWEDTTGALDSTRAFGRRAQDKGLAVEVDLWGHDVPHDWPSWRRMLAHHLPRFC
jgi:esterase/lipase superfamily enzyme